MLCQFNESVIRRTFTHVEQISVLRALPGILRRQAELSERDID